ncbi:MAG: hypothetical protein ABIU54_05140, partial [Candidatus Eisenbacteria bacterium]
MNNVVALVRFLRSSLEWAVARLDETLIARELQPVRVRVAAPARVLHKVAPALILAASLSALAGTASAEVWRDASDMWADG